MSYCHSQIAGNSENKENTLFSIHYVNICLVGYVSNLTGLNFFPIYTELLDICTELAA